MANRALVVALAILMQLSFNTATEANINDAVASENIHNINNEITIDEQNSFIISITDLDDLTAKDDTTNYNSNELSNNEIVSEYIRENNPLKPMVALTYDDGPSKYTEELLDVLKDNNSAATFFVLGSQVSKYEETIIRMIEEGNQVGNHSYDHKRLTLLNDEDLYNQINKTDNLIYDIAYYNPFVIRPPYGSTNKELLIKLQRPIINWSIDTRDWESRNTGSIIESILQNVKDGDIILMHDLYETTIEASKLVIPELINRGYQLVTVSELSEHKDIILKAGQSYYNLYK